MVAVLKDAAGVRRLTMPVGVAPVVPPAPAPVDPAAQALAAARDEAARLRAECDRLHAAAATAARQSRAAIEAARGEGFAQGEAAALAAAADRAADRIARIATGLAAEATRFGERLAAMDRLAAAMVRAALARMFAQDDAMADRVVATLRRHIALLRAESALAVRVSAADFDDARPVERALAEAGHAVAVTIDAALPSGACRVALRLGRVDLDIPAQAAALLRVFDTAAA